MAKEYFVKEEDIDVLKGNVDNKISSPNTAKVGQILSVKAIDENGKPTAWEVVNKPGSAPGESSPYIYMTRSDYRSITPINNMIYWVVDDSGKHGVYKNGSLVEGEEVATYIYGATWNGTSSTSWTRTDRSADFPDPVSYVSGSSDYGSPFDNLYPWSEMKITERTGGTMVSIPKFWYKIAQNGNGMNIQIADGAVDGFSVSPAHMDRGDGKGERDVVYIGRYHSNSQNYKSLSSYLPWTNMTRSSARSSIHNLGSNIWQSDFAMRFTIWLLYIVEFANWNSKSLIGYGGGSGDSCKVMGYTDTMPYHTGTTQSSRTTYGYGTQYRYIEGLWDNVLDWLDGCYYNSNGLNIIINPNNFNDSSNGISVGTPKSGFASAYSVKNISGTFPLFIPTASNGSETTYSCQDWGFNSSCAVLFTGSWYANSLNYNLFYIGCYDSSNYRKFVGCRLIELP